MNNKVKTKFVSRTTTEVIMNIYCVRSETL